MKISVYDTFVTNKENQIMHFDILIEENDTQENAHKYGQDYLKTKGLTDYPLTTKECSFCHMEQAPEEVEREVKEKGYFIIEMENCN
jgi:hypothetical protein